GLRRGAETATLRFLASGQQIAVDGVCPSTEWPYEWHGGNPAEVSLWQLPRIEEADARALLQAATELLVKAGWTRESERYGIITPGWDAPLSNIKQGIDVQASARDLAAKLIGIGMTPERAAGFLRDLKTPIEIKGIEAMVADAAAAFGDFVP